MAKRKKKGSKTSEVMRARKERDEAVKNLGAKVKHAVTSVTGLSPKGSSSSIYSVDENERGLSKAARRLKAARKRAGIKKPRRKKKK